ncbi:uncharacterized protein LOC106642595 [Copidosoma floridanum]|uniref:uncharacterized protein LOC106642595 n=1 Tax=Copidosoma floridanum TaxID=29053 RepID=UPI0006C94DC9|nr:uncharacterized protein LOC106642595 [Copidosoma floridanum]
MMVGAQLFGKYRDVIEVKSRGPYSSAEIRCKTPHEANKIIKDDPLKEYGLKVYIPTFRQVRRGIIRGVPNIEILSTPEKIISMIESPNAKIIDAQRLKRKNRMPKGEDDKWIPCETVLLTFEGQTLPLEVKACYTTKKWSHMSPGLCNVSSVSASAILLQTAETKPYALCAVKKNMRAGAVKDQHLLV